MGFVKLPFLCRARVRVSSSQLCSLGTRLPLPGSLPPAGEIRREERCHWRPDCVINMQEGMWELRANPRGPGGGRLISPSALPLPGILFCLFLCLSLGPDPVNEINEVRAEIFSVQDTSGLWPFPWLQWAAESLCLSFPACLVWMAHRNTQGAFDGSIGDEIGKSFLLLEASETSFSSVLASTLLQPRPPHQADVSCVLLWGCHQVTVTELCDTRWAQGSVSATPTYSGHQYLGLPSVKGPVQHAEFCFQQGWDSCP